MKRIVVMVALGLCLAAPRAEATKSPKPAPGQKKLNDDICSAVACLVLSAPNASDLKTAGKIIVSNNANISACKASHGKTGPEMAKANAYALPGGGGPVVVNADKMAAKVYLELKMTMFEEFTHAGQSGQLPAGYCPGLFRKLTLADAQFEYNEVRAKIAVLQFLEEFGQDLVDDPDEPVTPKDLDSVKKKIKKQLESHAGNLLKKLESLAGQDAIAQAGVPPQEKKARDIWTKCLMAAAFILGW